MIECPIYYVMPGDTGVADPPPPDPSTCVGCNCGYLQFEDLIPYLPEIRDAAFDTEKYTEKEFKLRADIVEVSRLFDMENGVPPGYFAKAHYTTTKVFGTNGTQFLRIPPFVHDTLVVRNNHDVILDPNSYAVRDGHLVFLPCLKHRTCGCSNGCGVRKAVRPKEWPDGCYKVTARWGSECADAAVQKAVRDYLVESLRMQDPVKTLANGIPVQRTFRVPHSWDTFVKNFKAKRKIFSGFAIA